MQEHIYFAPPPPLLRGHGRGQKSTKVRGFAILSDLLFFLLYIIGRLFLLIYHETSGADPGFHERGFICIKVCACVWGARFADLSHFSLNIP